MNKIVSYCIYSIVVFLFCFKIPPKAGTPLISFCKDAVMLPNLTIGVDNFKVEMESFLRFFTKTKINKNVFLRFNLYYISRACKNSKFVKW